MNIVHLFCDELRQDALGCYGNSAGPMLTPNFDSIAKRGTLFENCFCNSPVCVPSRASMLTGLYPEELGVFHNEAAYEGFSMPCSPVTFPEVLRSAGYRTANFGKTHIPGQMHPFELDDTRGGEMSLGLSAQERSQISMLTPCGRKEMCLAGLYPDKPYAPETVTAHALEWMKQQTEPYYVRISFLQPHTPVIVKHGYEKVYETYPFSGEMDDISELSQFEQQFASILRGRDLSEQDVIRAKKYYYGMVKWVDDQVGIILDFLKDQMEDTIILVNSDHGALRGECQGLSKQIFNRACHAVPLIIFDPRRPGGTRRKEMCSNIDLAATLLGMLDIPKPDSFHGTDLFRSAASQTVYATIGFGQHDSYAMPMAKMGSYQNGGWPRRACIRREYYRLDMTVMRDGEFVSPDQEDLFFVDTQECPRENRNMAGDARYADLISEMRQELWVHCQGNIIHK